MCYLISTQSLNLGGHQGTADDVATIPFYPSLSSAARRESPNPIPVHSLMLSSYLFFYLPLLLAPFTVPCRIVFAMPEHLEMWPYHLSFRFFTMIRRSSCIPVAFWILLRTSLFVTGSHLGCLSSFLSCLDRLHFVPCGGSIKTVYQDASFFFLFCIYDNVICIAEVGNESSPDADTPSWSSKVSHIILSRKMLKRVGESRHPCRTPTVVLNHSPVLPLNRNVLSGPCHTDFQWLV